MAAKIRKGDKVEVLSGKDRGRQGEVLRVFPRDGKALVEGINVVTRHEKPRAGSSGGRVKKPNPVDLSNVAVLDPKDNKPVRVGFSVVEGKKVRVSKRSGEVIETKVVNKRAEKS
jgi:large subunit ribosomal protein L24